MKVLLDFILISGVVINSIILWFLSRKSNIELTQKVLKFFFVCTLFLLLNFYSTINETVILCILTMNIADVAAVLIGPLLMLYVKSLFDDNKNLLKQNTHHFIVPIVYFFIISVPILFILLFAPDEIQDQIGPFAEYIYISSDIFLLIYLLISYKALNKYLNITKSVFSNLKDKDLKWIKHMLIGVFTLVIIDLLTFVYDFIYPETEVETGFVTISLLVVFLYYLGYYGINQSKILLPNFLINEAEKENKKEAINHLSNTSNEDIKTLIYRLEEILIVEKVYLEEDLTLHKLAKKIPITDKKLSTLLNKHLDTTFYDLINKYRVESVKEKINLNEYENITLLGIAYESGFNSKTSFNRIFKKETGFSPSEYKNASCQI